MKSTQVGASGADVGGGTLRDLIEQFQSVSSVHFRASAELTLSEVMCCPGLEDIPPYAPISGEMEYWAAGEKYRINSYVDPAKYPGMDIHVAYDGERFQLLRGSASTLSYSVHDNAVILPILPNPLLELLQFRYPVTDENFEFRLRMKDVVNDQTPDEFWTVKWVKVEENGRVLERAEFPGGIYEGREYVHHVYGVPGSRNKPVRIDRVTAEGVMTSTEFSHYIQVDTAQGPTFWPSRVVLHAFDVEGKEAVKIALSITDFSVDSEIPPEIFTISPERAERVWDDDREEFVASPVH